MKIALLEDDNNIANHLKNVLCAQGWDCQRFTKIQELLSALLTQDDFSILVLDRILSDGDSVDSLKKIKTLCPTAKVIILSSIDFPKEKAKWLEAGADEYMGKPIFSDELIARIKLIMLRQNSSAASKIIIKDLVIDRIDRHVYHNSKPIDLSAKEYNLLCLFVEKKGRIFNKFQILEHHPSSGFLNIIIDCRQNCFNGISFV